MLPLVEDWLVIVASGVAVFCAAPLEDELPVVAAGVLVARTVPTVAAGVAVPVAVNPPLVLTVEVAAGVWVDDPVLGTIEV